MDNKKYKYYSIEELNDPANKERLKGTKKYYYKRLKEAKEKRKYVECPKWSYANLGVEPRNKKPTNTGNRCSIGIKWSDGKHLYNDRSKLVRKTKPKKIIEEPTFIKKKGRPKKDDKNKKDKPKNKDFIPQIKYVKPEKPIIISFS
jgi:hypothetical protein